MSLEALNWAFKLPLPNSGNKLVLLTLANFVNDDNEAYPSQKTLADMTCLSERAVRDNLSRLEELGVIERTPRVRGNGSYTTDLFKLNVGMVLSSKIHEPESEGKTQRQILPTADLADGRNFQTQRQKFPNPAADSAAPESLLTTTFTKSNPPARMQAREALNERGVAGELAEQWILIRETKAQEINPAALDLIQSEALAAGITFEQAIRCCCDNVWAWFKAKWFEELEDKSKYRSAHGPPKASTGESGSGLNGGVLRNRRAEEPPEVYAARRKKMLEELGKFKATTDAKIAA